MFGIENKEKDQSDSLFGENPLVLLQKDSSCSTVGCILCDTYILYRIFMKCKYTLLLIMQLLLFSNNL